MLLSGLYMAFRLKLMFSLFAGNPKQNSEPKYHLMKDRINEFVRQIRYNILQMKNIDFRSLPSRMEDKFGHTISSLFVMYEIVFSQLVALCPEP